MVSLQPKVVLREDIFSDSVFAGNSNLVYTIIRKRQVFHALANLPSDVHGISKCLNSRKGLVAGQMRPVSTAIENAPIDQPAPVKLARSAVSNVAVANTESPTPTPDDDDFSDIEGKVEESMEGSRPAQPAEPGTLKVSLLDTPAIGQMTERESAHPSQSPLADFASIEVDEVNHHASSNSIANEYDSNAAAVASSSRENDQVGGILLCSIQIHT